MEVDRDELDIGIPTPRSETGFRFLLFVLLYNTRPTMFLFERRPSSANGTRTCSSSFGLHLQPGTELETWPTSSLRVYLHMHRVSARTAITIHWQDEGRGSLPLHNRHMHLASAGSCGARRRHAGAVSCKRRELTPLISRSPRLNMCVAGRGREQNCLKCRHDHVSWKPTQEFRLARKHAVHEHGIASHPHAVSCMPQNAAGPSRSTFPRRPYIPRSKSVARPRTRDQRNRGA